MSIMLRLGNPDSDLSKIPAAPPQQSILSPILFKIQVHGDNKKAEWLLVCFIIVCKFSTDNAPPLFSVSRADFSHHSGMGKMSDSKNLDIEIIMWFS